MTESIAAGQKYKFVPYGGGVEELDRFGVRDRIRAGDIDAATELALVGTDQWLPATSYPELVRYFELASRGATRPGVPLAAPKVRPSEPMGERAIKGLLYPLDGGQVLTLLGFAVFSALPVLGLMATLASPTVMLEVVRKSADGKTKMPAFFETANIPELLRHYFKVLFVTLVAAGPLILAGGWAIIGLFTKSITPPVALTLLAAAAAIGAIYYPACLATVAVWDSALSALNPVYVVRVISIIGRDYFVVIGIWFAATALTIVMRVVSPFSQIPLLGSILSSFLSYYVLFYASHLLGYAVFRHEFELGWN